MKRFLLVAAVFAAVAMATYAAAPLRDNSSPMSEPIAAWDAVAQAFRSLALDSNGALQVVGTFTAAASTATPTYYTPTTDARGRVGRGVTTAVTTSLTVPTVLSTIATFSLPCLVEVSWTNPVLERDATTTAATYATTAHTYSSGGEKSYLPGVAGWDRGFLATGTVGTLIVTVWPLVP
jgi:hypothetical protein